MDTKALMLLLFESKIKVFRLQEVPAFFLFWRKRFNVRIEVLDRHGQKIVVCLNNVAEKDIFKIEGMP